MEISLNKSYCQEQDAAPLSGLLLPQFFGQPSLVFSCLVSLGLIFRIQSTCSVTPCCTGSPPCTWNRQGLEGSGPLLSSEGRQRAWLQCPWSHRAGRTQHFHKARLDYHLSHPDASPCRGRCPCSGCTPCKSPLGAGRRCTGLSTRQPGQTLPR